MYSEKAHAEILNRRLPLCITLKKTGCRNDGTSYHSLSTVAPSHLESNCYKHMPRLALKPDSSFFRKIAIGAVGSRAICTDLSLHGHNMVELEARFHRDQALERGKAQAGSNS